MNGYVDQYSSNCCVLRLTLRSQTARCCGCMVELDLCKAALCFFFGLFVGFFVCLLVCLSVEFYAVCFVRLLGVFSFPLCGWFSLLIPSLLCFCCVLFFLFIFICSLACFSFFFVCLSVCLFVCVFVCFCCCCCCLGGSVLAVGCNKEVPSCTKLL